MTVVFLQDCATLAGALVTVGRSLIVTTLLQLLLDELVGLLPADDTEDIDEVEMAESKLSNEEAQLASADVAELVVDRLDNRCWHL